MSNTRGEGEALSRLPQSPLTRTPLPLAAPRLPEGRIPSSCAWKEECSVVEATYPGPSPPQLLHPHANLPHFPTWFRVLCDFCIQARHWSYRRKLRFEQYACFLSQPRNCLSSRRTGPELGSPPRGSHTPPPGPGRSKESGAAVSGAASRRRAGDGGLPSQTSFGPGKVGKGVRCGPSVTRRECNTTAMETGK